MSTKFKAGVHKTAPPVNLLGPVTAENYLGRAVDFVRGRGGEGFVIRTRNGSHGSVATQLAATEAQWHAWMVYFSTFKTKMAIQTLASFGMTTVPCEWPDEFDNLAWESDREYTPPPLPEPERKLSLEERRAVIAKCRAVMDAGGLQPFPDDRRQKTPPGHLRPPAKPLTDPSTPLTVSNRLRQQNAARQNRSAE